MSYKIPPCFSWTGFQKTNLTPYKTTKQNRPPPPHLKTSSRQILRISCIFPKHTHWKAPFLQGEALCRQHTSLLLPSEKHGASSPRKDTQSKTVLPCRLPMICIRLGCTSHLFRGAKISITRSSQNARRLRRPQLHGMKRHSL